MKGANSANIPKLSKEGTFKACLSPRFICIHAFSIIDF